MSEINGRRPQLVIAVSGSSAAYKICSLIRLLRKSTDIHVALTDSAREFVTPKTLAVLTGTPVLTDLFDPRNQDEHPHIRLAKLVDVFLLAPATANMLGKLAHCIADDAVSTLALSISPERTPCFIAPTMAPPMFGHPAVQMSLERLQQWGYRLIAPVHGRAACDTSGIGRMAEPQTIADALKASLQNVAARP